MITMKRHMLIAALLLPSFCAFSQNINPTVRVTNDYRGKIMEVHKGELPLSIADSLLKFDWNFDYAVTDNPYRGAYDFTPYLIDTTPEAEPLRQGKLYVRAGAGYSFRPEASVVYTPFSSSKSGLSVYDDFGGFSGNYSDFSLSPDGEKLVRDGYSGGHLYRNRLGVNGRLSLGRPELLFDVGTDLLRSDSRIAGHSYNSFDAKGSLAVDFSKWNLLLDAGLRRGSDSPVTSLTGDYDISETVLDLGFRIVREYADSRYFEFHPSVKSDFIAYGASDGEVSLIKLSALYKADFSRSHLRAGALLSVVAGSVDEGMVFLGSGSSKPSRGNWLYPDLYADFLLVPQTLKVYAFLSGGPRMDELKSVLDERPFISPVTNSVFFADVVSVPYDAEAGITGRIGGGVQYKLDVGYRKVENALFESIYAGSGGLYLSKLLRAGYNLLHFDAQMSLETERYEAKWDLTLQSSSFTPSVTAVALPAVKSSASFTYNWNKRIYGGISAAYVGRRVQSDALAAVAGMDCGYDTVIPGYLDLGLNAEYRYNRRLGFWLRSGNLLGQPVYQQILMAPRGPWVTVGLTFSL